MSSYKSIYLIRICGHVRMFVFKNILIYVLETFFIKQISKNLYVRKDANNEWNKDTDDNNHQCVCFLISETRC